MSCAELQSVHERAVELGYPLVPGAVERVALPGGDVALSALRWRDENPSLILLHGGGQSSHTWDSMLLQTSASALCIDLPGHGHSGWYDDPAYTAENLGTSLLGALRRLGGGPFTVAGMSLGALAALNCAARAPDLVQRVVIIDASPGLTPDRSAPITDLMGNRVFDDEDDVIALLVGSAPGEHRNLRRSLRYSTRRLDDGRIVWRYDQRPRADGSDQTDRFFEVLPASWRDVSALTMPALLVVAQESRIVSAADVAEYHRRASDLTSVTVLGSGHAVQSDQPRVLASLLGLSLLE